MITEIHRRRRERLCDAMLARGGGIAIQPTAAQRLRNRDNEFPYRFDSHFFYLTGFVEPHSLLVLVANGGERRAILFCQARDERRELWEGFRHGPEAAREHFGFDAAFAIEELDAQMPGLIADCPALFYPLAGDPDLERRIGGWLVAVRAASRLGQRAPAQAVDLHAIVDEMRLIKDAAEVEAMRRAAAISAQAHVRAMRATRPGRREYHLEAELLHEFRSHGAQPAYNAIVAAGANACVLHYQGGEGQLRSGELCLIDAGCEVGGYAADVSRTFPVDGSFSAAQRDVYGIVLAAQQAAFAAVRPGNDFNAPHEAAVRVLAQGMIDLGLLQGSLDAVLEAGTYRQFYMHRTGHWLGLDVHDVGDTRAPESGAATEGTRPWRRLAAGMVLTVEPGLYLRPAANVPSALSGIGIRIEDDLLVTGSGHEVLTGAAPSAAAQIEALMQG